MTRAILLAVATATLFPFYWMAITALSPADEIFNRAFRLVPSRLAFENFSRVWNMYPYGAWLLNSAVVSLCGAGASTLLSVMAGYAFAKFQFRAKNLLFGLMICTMMIPEQVLLAPQFLLVAAMNGVDRLWAVILPGVAQAFGVFLSRQFLASLPDDLLDAARLDGASEWQIFWRIVLPLTKPLAAVLFLFAVLDRWNQFVWPMVVLQDQRSMTLPVGLSLLFGEHSTDWSAVMGIALLTVAPMLFLFMYLQRYLVRGIARDGIR